MKLNKAKGDFIQAWGSLGSSWGINKAMAQLHALLLVSPKPLSTDDMMEQLQMSRGNVNMNIRALMDWGIVHKVLVPGERKEYYRSEKDVWKLAKQVAKERKKRELEPILRFFDELKHIEPEQSEDFEEFIKVTDDLETFAIKSTGILDKFLNADEHWFYGKLEKLIK